MAVETRENIRSLFVNSLKQLSIASGTDSKELWNKISALKSDSVVKNLVIEEQTANSLMAHHIPFNLLLFHIDVKFLIRVISMYCVRLK